MLKRVLIILLPLLLTPVVLVLVAEGFIDLGGGDKDTLVVFPWVIWSTLFLIIGLVRWRQTPDNFVLFSNAFRWSSLIMLTLWLGVYVYSTTVHTV